METMSIEEGRQNVVMPFEADEYAQEAVLMWGDNVLHVAHVPRGDSFVLGTGSDADYVLSPHFGFVSWKVIDEDGDVTLPPGDVSAALWVSGVETKMVPGSLRSELSQDDALLSMSFGELRLLVRRVSVAEKVASKPTVDRRPLSYIAGSMLFHALLVGFFYMAPPPASSLAIDRLHDTSLMAKYMVEPDELLTPEVDSGAEGTEGEKNDGEAAAGETGEMGDPSKVEKVTKPRKYKIKGTAKNAVVPKTAAEMAKRLDVLGALASASTSWAGNSSPFGADQALGPDTMTQMGHLTGSLDGMLGGGSGLAVLGTGRGAGGTGDGTLGVGKLGTLGGDGKYGSCSGTGCMGSGRAISGRGKPKFSPTLRGTVGKVSGGLSKEAIRRVVHRHHNEVKHCYERELKQRPDLAGRVTTRFMIDASGKVMNSRVVGSTLKSSPVESCVAKSVMRWSFPSPEMGGVVVVNYPFSFASH